MKNILRALVLIGVVLALSSCLVIFGFIRGDKVVIDGDEYDLAKLYTEYLGEGDPGVHILFVLMASEDIDISSEDISGNGELVVLLLAAPEDELVEGTYDYSDSPEEFAFGGGFIYVGYDSSMEDVDEYWYIADGTIEVKQLINDDFMIEGELELEDDLGENFADATLFFQGPIDEEFDFSDYYASYGERLQSLGVSGW